MNWKKYRKGFRRVCIDCGTVFYCKIPMGCHNPEKSCISPRCFKCHIKRAEADKNRKLTDIELRALLNAGYCEWALLNAGYCELKWKYECGGTKRDAFENPEVIEVFT